MKNQTKSATAPAAGKRESKLKVRKQKPGKAGTKAAKPTELKEIAAPVTERSAVTCFAGGQARVIYNPTHSVARQNSDIAHELAHILLEHDPGKMVLSHDASIVMRGFDAKQEEEANCLGWSLLLPRSALSHATKERLDTKEIARKWAVSEQLVEYRTRITGIRRQFSRQRAV